MSEYPEKEMANMLAEFTPQMWNEIRHLVDAIELAAYGMTGQSDWREVPPLPRSIIEPIVDRLDTMMRRLLANHGRLDLVGQWQGIREAILPSLAPPSLQPPDNERRASRERLCGRAAKKKKAKLQ